MIDTREIIMQFKIKDYQSFDVFYAHTKKSVFFTIQAIIKDPNLIEDLMQDTYVKFLAQIDKVNEQGNVSAYLAMIARNIAIDFYRKRKKEVITDEVFDTIKAPIEQDTEQEQYEVFKLLNLLDDEEKQIVTLHVINDLKFREVSEIMNKPIGTILWLYQRAIKKMKKKVGDVL